MEGDRGRGVLKSIYQSAQILALKLSESHYYGMPSAIIVAIVTYTDKAYTGSSVKIKEL